MLNVDPIKFVFVSACFFQCDYDVLYVTGIMNVWRNCIELQPEPKKKRIHYNWMKIANNLLRNEHKKCVPIIASKTSFEAMQVSSTFGFIWYEMQIGRMVVNMANKCHGKWTPA